MEYQCLLCGDIKFSSRYGVVRHLEEKHSGFRWECQQCSKLFPRQANGTHNDPKGEVCKGTVFLCMGPDGSRGSAARNQLDNWRRTALPSLWKSTPAKGQRKRRPSRRESPPHKRAKPEVVTDVSPARSFTSLPPSPKVSLGAASPSRSRSPSPKKTARKVMSRAVISYTSSSSSSESSDNRSPSPIRTVFSETILPPVTPPVTPKKTPPSTPPSKKTVVLSLGAARTSVIKALPDVTPHLT
ncbi:histone H3.v1-like [Mizuhopecten yessoensis]|uniref:Uncharacterized protein n=1 Tax=Mizuhopecten yessoensis TaxID=6573 RepID=A0A210PRN7_MIZYE|nr:histone H3.v1-like [Mizuhopecten yessoensis]OWF39106.1 hypothetical protein KP79_PYT22763 [Mizuhopecten yessoensis]